MYSIESYNLRRDWQLAIPAQCILRTLTKSFLAHPKTRGFISHAGLNSVNEAAIHGVPMVTIPLFADQLYNAAIANKMGVGVFLDVTQITEQSVYDALRELLENAR